MNYTPSGQWPNERVRPCDLPAVETATNHSASVRVARTLLLYQKPRESRSAICQWIELSEQQMHVAHETQLDRHISTLIQPLHILAHIHHSPTP